MLAATSTTSTPARAFTGTGWSWADLQHREQVANVTRAGRRTSLADYGERKHICLVQDTIRDQKMCRRRATEGLSRLETLKSVPGSARELAREAPTRQEQFFSQVMDSARRSVTSFPSQAAPGLLRPIRTPASWRAGPGGLASLARLPERFRRPRRSWPGGHPAVRRRTSRLSSHSHSLSRFVTNRAFAMPPCQQERANWFVPCAFTAAREAGPTNMSRHKCF